VRSELGLGTIPHCLKWYTLVLFTHSSSTERNRSGISRLAPVASIFILRGRSLAAGLWPDPKKEGKIDVNSYNFANLTLILLLQYLAKCRSRSLAVYNNEFILDSACVGSENH